MKDRMIVIGVCLVMFFLIAVFNVYLDEKSGQKNDKYEQEEVLRTGTLCNVFIADNEGTTVTAYIQGELCELQLQEAVTKDLSHTIADLKLKDGVVEKITLKKERISGTVLAVDEKNIEINGYGKLPLEEGYKVYKVYGELEQKAASDVLVGYDQVDFVVANGQVCAALLTEPIEVKNIRVLLKTTGYETEFHKKVVLTASSSFLLQIGEKKTEYQKGEQVTLSPTKDSFGKEERIQIVPKEKDGKITVLSIERSCGAPSYRGSIEVCWKKNKGLLDRKSVV